MTKQCGPSRSRRITSLDEAKTLDDGVVVLTSDWGGQILGVARAAAVQCDEVALVGLLADLDELAWPSNNMQGSALWFREATVGSQIGGGMGGGWVSADVWTHESLVQAGAEEGIRCVLGGRCRRLPPPEPVVDGNQRSAILRAYTQRLPANGLDFGWGRPEGWSTMHFHEIRRRRDEEIPPRPDGQRWWGSTLRAVVRQAGHRPWGPRFAGADARCGETWPGSGFPELPNDSPPSDLG